MLYDPIETRRKIVEAGLDLFYAASIAEVGVDQIAARAGVTKKTLYYHFPSKDVLVAACFTARAGITLDRYQGWAADGAGLIGQLRAVFAALSTYTASPAFHGCGFMRAASELASRREHPAVAVIAGYKRSFEDWLAALAREEGYADPSGLARQLIMLLDGCLAHIMFHRDASYTADAARAVEALVAGAAKAGA